MMRYCAHSDRAWPESAWQPLAEHLRQVAELARRFALEAIPNDADFAQRAYVAGLLHDLGKYRPEFQEMLRGVRQKGQATFHKQAGAAQAHHLRCLELAYAIAGHHGNLPDREELQELVLGDSGLPLAGRIWQLAVQDCAELAALHLDAQPKVLDSIQFDFRVRLLFSCLVDADWQDTSDYYDRLNGRTAEATPAPLDPQRRLGHLQSHLEALASQNREPRIAQIRHEILRAALKAAEQSPGMFSLTVPTGGGKTFASLAFALAHAARFGLRRVIYVAPFLSILEQNARAIREALGIDAASPELFEHHSLSDPGEVGTLTEHADDETGNERGTADRRRAENWDAPLIVTTHVQFFESLLSARPGRCRKLHNLARSVIILDECQSLPPGLIAPTCSVLNSLATDAGASIVLCTATQPAWYRRADLDTGLTEVREIATGELDLFRRLVRVRVTWPQQDEVPWSWADIVERMLQQPAALTVVNTKRAALEIYQKLCSAAPRGAYHLSTSMCPAHRLQVIDRVRRQLADGKPCYLVSTQLIEAGVDLDFPCVMRELAPLEAIIQAAGRCNREGRLNSADNEPGGRVQVFRALEGSTLVDWYRRGAQILEHDFLKCGVEPDIGEPAQLSEYFRRLYKNGSLDTHELQLARRKLHFASVGRLYRLIADAGIAVAVPSWEEAAEEIEGLLTALQQRPQRRLFRQLARYQVNIRLHQQAAFGALIDTQRPVPVWMGQYDKDAGIVSGDLGDWVC